MDVPCSYVQSYSNSNSCQYFPSISLYLSCCACKPTFLYYWAHFLLPAALSNEPSITYALVKEEGLVERGEEVELNS